jgi:hypothetical protein
VSHLIVFRTYPDIDHIAPLAWKLLEEGEEVHAVVAPGYDPSRDHRIAVLRRYPRFHLHQIGSGPLGRLRNTLPYALFDLLRRRARVLGVEWGYGLDAGYDRLLSPAGVLAVARSLGRSLVRGPRLDPHQTRTNYVVAARLLGRASFCLPHGLNIKLDAATTDDARAKLANGGFDYSDRNRFTRYVMNTEHHRRFQLEHAKGDPAVIETWGALRWSPAWFELNRRAAPEYAWPRDADRLKVVFMLPKWRNRVHVEAVIELVRRLQDLDFVSLAIKGHARAEFGSADPLHGDPEIDWDRILDVSKVDSVSLIAAADAVLDVGSSIGLEVVLQGKLLVNPVYIHELRTLFDAIPDSCVVAHGVDEVERALRAAAAGDAPRPTREALDELLRRAVYGGRDPYDVPQLYYDRITELATQRR